MELRARYQNMHDVVADLEEFQASIDPAVAEARAFGRRYEQQVEAEEEEQQQEEQEEAVADETEPPAEESSEVFVADQHEVKAVTALNVLCLEAQTEIQDALRKNLSRMGYRVLLMSDPERASERYCEAPTDAVIVDVDGLGTEAIDALVEMHDKAEEDGHILVALVLLGPRQGALMEKLPPIERLMVLSKPVKMKDVQDAITELLPIQ
jgi:CheY-like chemotaxis protein